ncbi:DDX54 isoform 6, partial [Pan troglodytes]
PSPESIKRAKEMDLVGLGLHPLFSSRFEEEELQRLRLVDSIKNYRSRADIFSEVVGRKRQRSGPNRGAKRRREEARQRDQEFYIPYRPKDFDSERGLSISGEGGAFEQQAAGAVLDLMGDEAQNLTRGRQQLKWDRKKKRFVGQSGQEDKKKIKTESGR